LISVETDEPFQHLDFHDGWWKIMIIEGARLWLPGFSLQLKAGNRMVIQCLKKVLFGIVNQWRLGGAMLITIVFDKKDV